MISWTPHFVILMFELVAHFQPNLTKGGLKNSKDPISFTKKSCVQERGGIIPRFASESQCCSTCQPACCHQSSLPGESCKAKRSCIGIGRDKNKLYCNSVTNPVTPKAQTGRKGAWSLLLLIRLLHTALDSSQPLAAGRCWLRRVRD